MAIIKSRLSEYSCQKISHSVENFCEQQKTSSFIGTVFKSTVNPYQRDLQRIRIKILRTFANRYISHRRNENTTK